MRIKTILFILGITLGGTYYIGSRLVALAHAGTLEKTASYFVYPVLWMQHVLVSPVKNYFKTRKTIQELTQHLQIVQQERDRALFENVELHALCDYQADTAELIDFKKRYQLDGAITSQIIAKQFSDHGHYFLVDAGQNKGIVKDMVALYNNCIIGRVLHVYPWYSKIVLVSDKSCKIAATTARTKAHGIYEGTNQSGAGKLSHVSHLSKVSVDDVVISSGEGLVFPRGFTVGKISSSKPHGLFHDVIVEPLIDLKELKFCLLVKRDPQLDQFRE